MSGLLLNVSPIGDSERTDLQLSPRRTDSILNVYDATTQTSWVESVESGDMLNCAGCPLARLFCGDGRDLLSPIFDFQPGNAAEFLHIVCNYG